MLLGHLDAQLGRDRERVDVVEALVRRAERAAQRREVSRREPVLARRPAVAISMRVTGPCGERHGEPPEPLGHGQERLEHAALVLGHERAG